MHRFPLRPVPCIIVLLACTPALACAPADDDEGAAASDAAATTDTTAAAADTVSAIADVGFATPESVLHDEQADVYLVSNINGEPLGRDDNGFIARIRPDGGVESLKWIDGAADAITLNAPKGMALHGDTLFVADIDSVRAFHRTSGESLGARGIDGVSFLNDMAAGPDGTLYVTDTGLDASFAPTGRDAVYRFGAEGPSALVEGAQLRNPNGIVAESDALVMVPFGSATVMRFPLDGSAPDTIATLPAGQLDGIVRTAAGEYIVTSWEGSAVYRIAADGTVTTLAENLEAPADLGYDARRQRVLIPLFNGNRVEVRRAN